ncbi:MAG: STT3 domain-containing protein [Nanoarchaeota archaeon]|nr:hypothetical protein [Nanoarchaeota archaeon]MBU4301064.1 hypothetical protein [Nanoarchaeota archaeon]MBU4451390.1 hypothetical protein [Nanoarchaeota archaeon]MCG2724056.1 glycosyltransferase family 39 protein [archaeon]
MSKNNFASKVNVTLRQNWHVLAVLVIGILALYIRLLSLPLVKTYLPDIDTYLFYRGSDYLLTHNFHFPIWDTLRNYPFGLNFYVEQPLPYYLPAIFYKIASIFSNMNYISLVKYYSPIVTSLSVIPMYLIGKELKNKWTGIFSAFFFAIMPAILMRNPAGYIEKEPSTIAFMMFSVYFFLRTLKKDSWISAALMGGFLTLVDIGWGGVDHLYLSYTLFAFMILFVNKYQNALIKNYVFLLIAISFGAYITNGSYLGSEHLMIYLTFVMVLARYAVDKFNLIKKESLKYFIPALSIGGLILVLIVSTFSPFFASFVDQASGILFYRETTFGGTVAENQRPDFGSFLAQFGTPYAAGVLPSLQPILIYFSAWILAFIALILSAYKTENKYKWMHIAAVIVAVLSFLMFLNKPGSTAQIIYLISFFTALFLFAKHGEFALTLNATLLFAAMLSFMNLIRVGFLVGPYISIFAGYFIAELISRTMNLNAVKNAATLEEKINVYSVGMGVLISIILIANLAAGYAIGSSMGPNYNNNWNDAMNFMKEKTPESSVMLSWWDFGYWFQAMSGRATMLDGGNNDLHGDKLTGLYFSGRMNESIEKEFLQSRGITHIIVDYSMIGKYAAMTRIGTDWQEIDQYIPLSDPQQAQKNGKTILIFQLGPSAFYVPITQNGTGTVIAKSQDSGDITIDGDVVFSQANGNVNLKYICTENGLIDLKPSEPSWDACLLITPYGWFFPVDASNGKPSTLTGTSTFAKLFFFNGKGVDYVKKVYDNPEIKIYEVELPRRTREELINWWKTNVDTFDMSSDFVKGKLKSLETLCINGNEITSC